MDYIVRMIAKDAPIKAMAIQGREMSSGPERSTIHLRLATAALGQHADGGLHDGTAD